MKRCKTLRFSVQLRSADHRITSPKGHLNTKILVFSIATLCGSIFFVSFDRPPGKRSIRGAPVSRSPVSSLHVTPESLPLADRQPAATAALAELKTLRTALQEARRAAADLEAVIDRIRAVERRAVELEADRLRLEAEASEPVRRFILSGGAIPAMSPEARQALESARSAAGEAARDARAAIAELPDLERRRANLVAVIDETRRAIRQIAIKVLANRHLEAEITAAVNAERQATEGRARAEAVIEFLQRAGYTCGHPHVASDRLGAPVSITKTWVELSHNRLRDARITKADPAISLQRTNALHEELEALVNGEFA